ncbi:MAG: hypothetical protein K9M01_04270 [Candidatus Omnitrophica bacterium]|nr:hypothetical protein [Candidatus Omnitrophota bacterium]
MAKKKKKFNNFKKSLNSFVKDEDGFVSKKTILRVGLGTVSALGVMGSLSSAVAGHTSHGVHSNAQSIVEEPVPGTSCYKIGAQHSSHPSHVNHDAY